MEVDATLFGRDRFFSTGSIAFSKFWLKKSLRSFLRKDFRRRERDELGNAESAFAGPTAAPSVGGDDDEEEVENEDSDQVDDDDEITGVDLI